MTRRNVTRLNRSKNERDESNEWKIDSRADPSERFYKGQER